MYIHACVYVFMYMYVRMYVCMYVCTYTCMCMCIYVCVYVCMYMRMYVCMSLCVYVCIYVCMYVCMYVNILWYRLMELIITRLYRDRRKNHTLKNYKLLLHENLIFHMLYNSLPGGRISITPQVMF